MLGGIAAGNAASYRAQAAENTAQIAKQNATYALQAGNANSEQADLKAAKESGAVESALAANNVDMNGGSAKEFENVQREKGAQDQETIANDAVLKPMALKVSRLALRHRLQNRLQ